MPKLPMGDISPCVIIWDYEGAGQMHIGPYLGTISFRATDSVADVQEEGFGDAPVDAVFAGTVVELDVPMARSTLVQLAATIGYMGMGSLSASGKVLTLKNMAGCDMYANAKQLVIVPICNNVPDPNPHSWTLLYKAHPYREFELGFDRNTQRVHQVKFKIFPNQDSGFCGEYGTEGVESGATPIVGIC